MTEKSLPPSKVDCEYNCGILFQQEQTEDVEGSDSEVLNMLPRDLLDDSDFVDTIMNEDDDIAKSGENLEEMAGK